MYQPESYVGWRRYRLVMSAIGRTMGGKREKLVGARRCVCPLRSLGGHAGPPLPSGYFAQGCKQRGADARAGRRDLGDSVFLAGLDCTFQGFKIGQAGRAILQVAFEFAAIPDGQVADGHPPT